MTIAPTPREIQQQFFTKLFGNAEGFLCITPGRPPIADKFFAYPSHIEDALDFIEANAERDVYFTVALLKHDTSRTKADCVSTTRIVHADADEIDPRPCDPKPSIAWETSPGRYQAAWIMNEAFPIAEVEQLARRMTYANDFDSGGWHCNKLLRVPLTRNTKYPDAPLGRMLEMNGTVDRSAFAHLPEVRKTAIGEVPQLGPAQPVAPERVSARLRALLSRQPNKSERSEPAFGATCEAVRSGFSNEEIRWLLESSPVGEVAREKGTSWIARTIANARSEIEASEHPILPDEFWNARPALTHIRQAAHSRGRSAPVVLLSTLQRVACAVPHFVHVPAIVGEPASLSSYVGVVSPVGHGKSTGAGIARALIPDLGEFAADQLPLGSGEGIIESFFDWLPEPNGKPEKIQTKFAALIRVDEGDLLSIIGGRSGSSLTQTLRGAWTGSAPLGQANADKHRRRILPIGQYVLGLAVTMQEPSAARILDDVAGGLPQRFLWATAVDPTLPEPGDEPPWPGPLDWRCPVEVPEPESDPNALPGAIMLPDPATLARDRAACVPVEMSFAPPICREIKIEDRARSRGRSQATELDAHRGLVQLKTAAALALLDGRLAVSEDDWRLARMIREYSDRVRARLVKAARAEAEKREERVKTREAGRAVAVLEATEGAKARLEAARVVQVAERVRQRLKDRGPQKRTDLVRNFSRERKVLDAALSHGVEAGWFVESEGPGTAQPSRVFSLSREGVDTWT